MSLLFTALQVSEESAEAWVDEFTASGPDFHEAKAAVEVRRIKPIKDCVLVGLGINNKTGEQGRFSEQSV